MPARALPAPKVAKESGFLLSNGVPAQVKSLPQFRYMGSKFRLLEWIHDTIHPLAFDTAVDAFSGSGAVSYLLKAMGKGTYTNDSLQFPSTLSSALIANNSEQLDETDLSTIDKARARLVSEKFIQRTFPGIFYTDEDLKFLDNAWCGIRELGNPSKQALAIAALLRSAVKRQPRGLFTVAGDPEKYKDGRRDLQLTLKEHFLEQAQIYNDAVFDNGKHNFSNHGDIFDLSTKADLVYMDPPYVPRSDDNCYMKRYHFLEGLSCYWKNQEIKQDSKVKKIVKPFTPFAYRRTALEAFDSLFRKFADSTLVLSYSSNAYPDLATLIEIMARYKKSVEVVEREHRYHFGTHAQAKRNVVQEYLIIGI